MGFGVNLGGFFLNFLIRDFHLSLKSFLRVSQFSSKYEAHFLIKWFLILKKSVVRFIFHPIKIRFKMAELWPKVAKQLAIAIMGDQLVSSQMTNQIVPIDFDQTNFSSFPIKIRLEMAKSSKIASQGNSGKLAGGQLNSQLDCTN